MVVVSLIVQWLHVLLAIFWLGTLLFINFVMMPVIAQMPLQKQRDFMAPITLRASRILPTVTILLILLGVLRGTVFGPIHSFSYLFGTAYGITFLVALVVTLVVGYIGQFVSGKTVERMNALPAEEVMKPGSTVSLTFTSLLQRIKVLIVVEMSCFLIILTCMILMRFSL